MSAAPEMGFKSSRRKGSTLGTALHVVPTSKTPTTEASPRFTRRRRTVENS